MLEAEAGRRAPSVNSMRILGAQGLLDSPVTAETLNVSWPTHSNTGRIAVADLSTHFQSSTSAVLLEGRRPTGPATRAWIPIQCEPPSLDSKRRESAFQVSEHNRR